MGFGSVFGNAWKEYTLNFVSILSFVALFYLLPFFVLGAVLFGVLMLSGFSSIFASSFLSGQEVLPSDLSIGFMGVFIVAMIIFVFFAIVISVFLYSAFYGLNVKKKQYTWRELASIAKSGFLRLLGRGILLLLFLAFLFLLLIIPGIIFSVYWIFAIFIWFNEPKLGFMGSLSKSKELVRGRWWKTFGYLLLITIISFGANIVLSFIPIIGGLLNVFVGLFVIYFVRHMYIDYSSNRK